VHRDIKPGNILNVNDIYKIGDFNISKIILSEEQKNNEINE